MALSSLLAQLRFGEIGLSNHIKHDIVHQISKEDEAAKAFTRSSLRTCFNFEQVLKNNSLL
ncbi:hypothetical protein KIN20_004272 [Parelaphostrongylus tenuis]|uniref:Uncharacterized protein n=1 Tax=Parelaphostrongylus tenuis TaxID=148309 RepID=A0AAD5M2U9_PARTN|nr:hypothetical protein KIN20_004272 [Parelaphostrongylus tenuis]